MITRNVQECRSLKGYKRDASGIKHKRLTLELGGQVGGPGPVAPGPVRPPPLPALLVKSPARTGGEWAGQAEKEMAEGEGGRGIRQEGGGRSAVVGCMATIKWVLGFPAQMSLTLPSLLALPAVQNGHYRCHLPSLLALLALLKRQCL